MVPSLFKDHAPLQSHLCAQPFGMGLHPYPHPTPAPSLDEQAVISQQPPFGKAAWTFVIAEVPGITPELSVHSWLDKPARQSIARIDASTMPNAAKRQIFAIILSS
jgi:hypothetical protein